MEIAYHRIFAALDGASTQEAVAKRAVQLASENHAELRFGHVVDAVPSEASSVDFDALSKESQAHLEQELASVLEAARADKNIPQVDVVVRAGAIIGTLDDQLIAEFDPDLVICGERGLSNIRYAFVGSVSTHLIRTLRCDVLVVKQS